jgi:hypothetical protein
LSWGSCGLGLSLWFGLCGNEYVCYVCFVFLFMVWDGLEGGEEVAETATATATATPPTDSLAACRGYRGVLYGTDN